MVVLRRPKVPIPANKCLPCEFCFGFIRQDCLWSHISTCKLKPTTHPESNLKINAKMLLAPFLDHLNDDEEEAEIDEIFDGMKETRDNPGLKNICEDDQLIREFTRTLLDKIGSQEEQRKKDKDNIRAKVRTVARIVKKLNETK